MTIDEIKQGEELALIERIEEEIQINLYHHILSEEDARYSDDYIGYEKVLSESLVDLFSYIENSEKIYCPDKFVELFVLILKTIEIDGLGSKYFMMDHSLGHTWVLRFKAVKDWAFLYRNFYMPETFSEIKSAYAGYIDPFTGEKHFNKEENPKKIYKLGKEQIKHLILVKYLLEIEKKGDKANIRPFLDFILDLGRNDDFKDYQDYLDYCYLAVYYHIDKFSQEEIDLIDSWIYNAKIINDNPGWWGYGKYRTVLDLKVQNFSQYRGMAINDAGTSVVIQQFEDLKNVEKTSLAYLTYYCVDSLPSLSYEFCKYISKKHLYEHVMKTIEIGSPGYCYKFLTTFYSDLVKREDIITEILSVLRIADSELYEMAIEFLEDMAKRKEVPNTKAKSGKSSAKTSKNKSVMNDCDNSADNLNKILNTPLGDVVDVLTLEELTDLCYTLKSDAEDKKTVENVAKKLIRKVEV